MRKGEILGIAGVDGNGQSELAEVIAGLRKIQEGKLLWMGSYHESVSQENQGMGFGVSTRRPSENTGLILEHSLENLILDRWYKALILANCS